VDLAGLESGGVDPMSFKLRMPEVRDGNLRSLRPEDFS
jgi:hypothetical protein